MSLYTSTSPYYTTGFTQFYLSPMVDRPIPREPDDLEFVITETYKYRPDMLAYDLYQDPGLWWVFYQRNPNALQAPPLDFAVGTRIFLPKMSTLRNALGF